jgi:hypothetical protein
MAQAGKAKRQTTTAAPSRRRKPHAGCVKLWPQPGGAIIRMYRIGHGDCFLIAFPGEEPDKPIHVLIDCGYKPGSPDKLAAPTTAREVAEDILCVTDGFVDVAVITHEHQDHVNGFTSENFPGLRIRQVWFAWTENPKDDVANALRKRFRDRLLGLIDNRSSLLALGKNDVAECLDEYLELELGDTPAEFNGKATLGAAGKDPAASANKRAMKLVRDSAPGEPAYLYPHGEPIAVPGAASARAFVLGPPRDMEKIDDLDPVGDENFADADSHGLMPVAGAPVATAMPRRSPFSRRHVIPLDQVFADPEVKEFFSVRYGQPGDGADSTVDGKEVPDNAAWRRLTADDAADADALALAMNNATNNASLVLAFELTKGGKVLLFAGDAQAGNWRSWSDDDFEDGREQVTAADLLGRTVVYKVGHHGSHNATLNGDARSSHASLQWMARDRRHAAEFTALITAVEKWAHQKPRPDWNHPLPAIKQALLEKAGGRVLQTDSSLPDGPIGTGAPGWLAFQGRVTENRLYFDLVVEG